LVFLFLFLFSTIFRGDTLRAETLRGIPGVRLHVVPPDTVASAGGLTEERIRIFIASRFRAAGINVAPSFKSSLIVQVSALKSDVDAAPWVREYMYLALVGVEQKVFLDRDLSISDDVKTFTAIRYGVAHLTIFDSDEKYSSAVLDAALSEAADVVINEYLSENKNRH
jgi:hypothetical protein